MSYLPRMADVRKIFVDKLKNEEYVTDKSGVKTIECIGISYIVDEDPAVLFGTLNEAYAEKELDWYISESRNVYDMPNPPKIWRMVCDKNGYINSNYGWMIFSKENNSQYQKCLRALRKNIDTRQALMIYQRPSMHEDCNKDGMSDFCCTNTVHVLIRNNRLDYVINQRSCDAIYGLKNDLYWHKYVQRKLCEDLREDYPDLVMGDMIHQVGSLHVYERHFNLVV